MSKPPRLAVRAVLLHQNRLLLVNAWRGRTDLWCAPGGGVDAHAALSVKPDSLAAVAWQDVEHAFYDTLEPIIR